MRRCLWLIAALLLAGCGDAARGANVAQVTSVAQPTAAVISAAAARRGEVLFRNKGCISCHMNTRVPGPQGQHFSAASGGPPNLSDYRNDPDFLRRWLADPRSVRPDGWMPNLGLSAAEIDDLIAFINEPR